MKIASMIFPYCAKVLPTVYDNSLSYYEQICKLTKCCEEIIDQLTDWSETIAQLQEAIKDIDSMKSDISRLDSEIIKINTNITELASYIDSINAYAKTLEGRIANNEEAIAGLVAMISNFNVNVDKKLADLEKKLTDMINNINSDFTEELHMLQLKVNQIKVNLQGQIDDIKERLDGLDTSVINPWHEELGRVQPDVNNKLTYADLADAVPTASEYCKLGLTADAYSNFRLTAIEYARSGKEKLHYFWVYSPAYGFRQEISNVLTSILNFIKNTLSATEYTALDLTADEYSALDMTAMQYYSYNPNGVMGYVTFDPSNEGLTSEQYSHLGIELNV